MGAAMLSPPPAQGMPAPAHAATTLSPSCTFGPCFFLSLSQAADHALSPNTTRAIWITSHPSPSLTPPPHPQAARVAPSCGAPLRPWRRACSITCAARPPRARDARDALSSLASGTAAPSSPLTSGGMCVLRARGTQPPLRRLDAAALAGGVDEEPRRDPRPLAHRQRVPRGVPPHQRGDAPRRAGAARLPEID